MKNAKAIDINAKAFQREVSDYLAKTPAEPSSIRLLRGETLVAEIVPAKEARYVAKNNLHSDLAEEAGEESDYKTMGESLRTV